MIARNRLSRTRRLHQLESCVDWKEEEGEAWSQQSILRAPSSPIHRLTDFDFNLPYKREEHGCTPRLLQKDCHSLAPPGMSLQGAPRLAGLTPDPRQLHPMWASTVRRRGEDLHASAAGCLLTSISSTLVPPCLLPWSIAPQAAGQDRLVTDLLSV